MTSAHEQVSQSIREAELLGSDTVVLPLSAAKHLHHNPEAVAAALINLIEMSQSGANPRDPLTLLLRGISGITMRQAQELAAEKLYDLERSRLLRSRPARISGIIDPDLIKKGFMKP